MRRHAEGRRDVVERSFSRLFAALSVAAAAAAHEDNDVSSSALPPPLTSLMCTLEAFLLMDVLVNLETEGGGDDD